VKYLLVRVDWVNPDPTLIGPRNHRLQASDYPSELSAPWTGSTSSWPLDLSRGTSNWGELVEP